MKVVRSLGQDHQNIGKELFTGVELFRQVIKGLNRSRGSGTELNKQCRASNNSTLPGMRRTGRA